MNSAPLRQDFIRVFFAYLDDSGTNDKRDPFQVVTAVIFPASEYLTIEFAAKATAMLAMPEDRREVATEFHASQLFWGHEDWKDVPQETRFRAIADLLSVIRPPWKIVYASVNKRELQKRDYSSADPQDMAFSACLRAVRQSIMEDRAQDITRPLPREEPVLCIADDGGKDVNRRLGETYRRIRGGPQMLLAGAETGLSSLMDDIYFGASKYSIGLQIADLCCWLIACHLRRRPEPEAFYAQIEEYIHAHWNLPADGIDDLLPRR